MKKLLISCLLCLLPFGQAIAEDRLVVLKDGSQIQGKIISYQDGIYVIRSASLGELKLTDQQVQSISTMAARAPVAKSNNDQIKPIKTAERSLLSGSLAQIQAQIASDPGIMSSVVELQNDPEMQALLADPEVMRAIQQFDLDALSRNPRIQKLMLSQKFKEIESRVSP
ncbi:MAG: hypothetical protein ACJAVI_000095 [Candidatus Azotimanducaceae bacterium]|jgi:hypothetical protein